MENQQMTIFERLSYIAQNVGAIAKKRKQGMSFLTRGKEEFFSLYGPEMANFGVSMGIEELTITQEKDALTKFKQNGETYLKPYHRLLAVGKVTFSCDEGSHSTFVAATKNDFQDFGAQSCISLLLVKAMETVFCTPSEEAFNENLTERGSNAPGINNPQKAIEALNSCKTLSELDFTFGLIGNYSGLDSVSKVYQEKGIELIKPFIESASSLEDLNKVWGQIKTWNENPTIQDKFKWRKIALKKEKVEKNLRTEHKKTMK
jgi:hypothetical protein